MYAMIGRIKVIWLMMIGSCSCFSSVPHRPHSIISNPEDTHTHTLTLTLTQPQSLRPLSALALAAGVDGGPSTLDFVKYEGLGNDFILVDNRASSSPLVSPQQAIRLCDRRFGIGGDGIIFALPGQQGCDYTMRIFNNDGSEPEMCGNGIRCMARYLNELEGKKAGDVSEYKIWTGAGKIVPVVKVDGSVRVNMGGAIFAPEKIPTTLPATFEGRVQEAPITVLSRGYKVTCVSMGNPHAIVFVDSVDDIDLHTVGPAFEKHEAFPARVNTEFVQVLSRTHLKMKVWERGAGPTLACGTGACALTVAAVITGRTEPRCTVTLPGGDLFIEWDQSANIVYMTGPATMVFKGSATF